MRGFRSSKQKVSRRRLLQALRGTHIGAAQMQGQLRMAESVLTRGLWGRLKWAVWEGPRLRRQMARESKS